MSLEYEKKKAVILKEMIENYKKELLKERDIALDMPIETDNGFNVERETIITDIDEKMEILRRHEKDPYFAKLIFEDCEDNEKFIGYVEVCSYHIVDGKRPNDDIGILHIAIRVLGLGMVLHAVAHAVRLVQG